MLFLVPHILVLLAVRSTASDCDRDCLHPAPQHSSLSLQLFAHRWPWPDHASLICAPPCTTLRHLSGLADGRDQRLLHSGAPPGIMSQIFGGQRCRAAVGARRPFQRLTLPLLRPRVRVACCAAVADTGLCWPQTVVPPLEQWCRSLSRFRWNTCHSNDGALINRRNFTCRTTGPQRDGATSVTSFAPAAWTA